MRPVQYGKVWVIETMEDYTAAIEALEDAAFVADMSDSYDVTLREKAEITKQLGAVREQAKVHGLI